VKWLSDIRRYDTIDEVNIRKRSILHEKFELKIETLNQRKTFDFLKESLKVFIKIKSIILNYL